MKRQLLAAAVLAAACSSQPGCETAAQRAENDRLGRYHQGEAIQLAAQSTGEAILKRLPEAVGGGPFGWITAVVAAASAGAAAYTAARRPGAKHGAGTQVPPAK